MAHVWFTLLQAQSTKNVGLTIPFLVGASRQPVGRVEPSENQNFAELVELLEAMRDSMPASHVVRIGNCTTLHQPVAALYPSTETFSAKEAVASASTGKVSLFVERRYKCNGTIDPVADFLWKELSEVITAGHFSFANGAYASFDANDLAFIAKAFGSNK